MNHGRKNLVSQEEEANRPESGSSEVNDRQVAVLIRLRNALNATYGYSNGAPRINLGPCGRFARDFRERWNKRFQTKINIVFVMTPDATNCHHVLVKLPDGSYYDGGNGVISAQALLRLYPDSCLNEMTAFDPILLDKWSYGLGRSYPACSNYSDEITIRLIDQHLAELPAPAAPGIARPEGRNRSAADQAQCVEDLPGLPGKPDARSRRG